MAIIKRFRKHKGWVYQTKIRGSDGKWITDSFPSRAKAEEHESKVKVDKFRGSFVTNLSKQLTVKEFFETWSKENINSDASEGWKKTQFQMFRDYVDPVIGGERLQKLNPGAMSRVLNRAAELGRGPATRLHIYGLMHKMMEDALDLYELIPKNPVIKKLRPKIPQRESAYLELEEVVRLLKYVEGRRHQVAIWLQLLAGLRVGEVQYLKWENVDLKFGVIHVRGTYRRREKQFHDVPKGKHWHRVKMPPELWDLLRHERLKSQSEFVAGAPTGKVMCYHRYTEALVSYCKKAGVPKVTTHGLRHSTAELYMANGASRDDLRILFDHSTSKMTDRYVHDKGRRLDAVANNVYLLRAKTQDSECSPNVPQNTESAL